MELFQMGNTEGSVAEVEWNKKTEISPLPLFPAILKIKEETIRDPVIQTWLHA
jgi:hypothetical protein